MKRNRREKRRNTLQIVVFFFILIGGLTVGFVYLHAYNKHVDLLGENTRVSELDLSLPDTLSNLPIQSPVGGTNTIQCGTSADGWTISQWNNEQSLCNGSPSDSVDCPGADFVRATITGRVCYWKAEKKIQLAVNTNAMNYQGCQVNLEPGYAQNPGGYASYLSYNISSRPDFYTSFPSLGQMTELHLVTAFSTDYFHSFACPSSITPFPGLKTNPVGTAYMSASFTNVKNPGHTLFYQVIFYDNRHTQDAIASDPIYKTCDLPNGNNRSGVFDDLVSRYSGNSLATPGSGIKNYDINILPLVTSYLSSCFGTVNLNDYKLTSMYIGSENYNTTVITVSAINPMVKIFYNALPSPTPTNTPTPTQSPAPTNIAPTCKVPLCAQLPSNCTYQGKTSCSCGFVVCNKQQIPTPTPYPEPPIVFPTDSLSTEQFDSSLPTPSPTPSNPILNFFQNLLHPQRNSENTLPQPNTDTSTTQNTLDTSPTGNTIPRPTPINLNISNGILSANNSIRDFVNHLVLHALGK